MKADKMLNTDNMLVDTIRLGQIKIAEEICKIIHSQILIISGLQQTQSQREYITDLYQAILALARSFNDERIEINRGE